MRASGRAGATQGADRLSRRHHITDLDFDTVEVDVDTGDALAMVETDAIAMDHEAVALVAHKHHASIGWGNHCRADIPAVVHAPMEIIIGEDAVVIAAHTIDRGDGAIVRPEQFAVPQFLGADDLLKGIHPIEFGIAHRSILARWQGNALGRETPVAKGHGQGLGGVGIDLEGDVAGAIEGRGGNQAAEPATGNREHCVGFAIPGEIGGVGEAVGGQRDGNRVAEHGPTGADTNAGRANGAGIADRRQLGAAAAGEQDGAADQGEGC